MKEKIIEIIGFGMEPERAELKANELIILFNEHMLKCVKANVSYTDAVESLFIKL